MTPAVTAAQPSSADVGVRDSIVAEPSLVRPWRCPDKLLELRATLLQQHMGRVRDGLV